MQGGPKHTEGCIPKKVQQKQNGVYTNQVVPVDHQLGIRTCIPWYKAYFLAYTQMSRLTQVPHCCKQGTHLCAPGVVGKGSLAASIGY
jgi:hypothetical protein